MKPAIDNPIRNAAVFVRSLAPDAAASLLTRLSADEASALRDAIRDLGADVDPEERRRVAEQAQTANVTPPTEPTSQSTEAGDVELMLSGADTHPATIEHPTATSEPMDPSEWLRSLGEEDAAAIATYLAAEQPGAVAMVLRHVAPELAAGVLAELDESTQPEVIAMLAVQGEPDPEAVRVIATGLTEWVADRQEQDRQRTDRVEALRKVLDATPTSRRGALLERLRVSDPETAEQLAPTVAATPPVAATVGPAPAPLAAPQPIPQESIAPPQLEQLERLDRRALSAALASLDGRTALLALVGAQEAVYARVTAGMSTAAIARLEQRLAKLGPTGLAEIDRAGRTFAEAAARVVAKRRRNRVGGA